MTDRGSHCAIPPDRPRSTPSAGQCCWLFRNLPVGVAQPRGTILQIAGIEGKGVAHCRRAGAAVLQGALIDRLAFGALGMEGLAGCIERGDIGLLRTDHGRHIAIRMPSAAGTETGNLISNPPCLSAMLLTSRNGPAPSVTDGPASAPWTGRNLPGVRAASGRQACRYPPAYAI